MSSPASEVGNQDETSRHQTSSLEEVYQDGADLPVIVFIEKRKLYAETLMLACASLDIAARFASFDSIEGWRSANEPGSLVLLSLLAHDRGNLLDTVRTEVSKLPGRTSTRLAVLADTEDSHVVLKMLALGAQGVIPASLPLHLLAYALRLILAGAVYVPEMSLFKPSGDPIEQEPEEARELLTIRELAVAKVLRRGTPNKLIAYNLNMTESTVKLHVGRIMKKLNAKNRTEIVHLTNKFFKTSDG